MTHLVWEISKWIYLFMCLDKIISVFCKKTEGKSQQDLIIPDTSECKVSVVGEVGRRYWAPGKWSYVYGE